MAQGFNGVFKKAQSQLNAATKQAAIKIMRASKQYFNECFDNEEFDGVKWAEVARRTAGSHFYENQVVSAHNQPTGKMFTTDQGADWQTRKINQGTTGRLRYKTIRADSSITNKGAVIRMFNPVPYAQYVNDGTPYMAARPFMGHAKQLEKRHLDILFIETGKTWQVK